MLGKPLAKFYDLRGFKVLEFQSNFWTPFRPKSRFLMTFPENAIVTADGGEIAEFLARSGSWAARYPTSRNQGTDGGYYVFRQKSFGLDGLGRNMKRSVQKGLERCRIGRLDPSELRVAGLEINQQTMIRQQRNEPEFSDPVRWGRFLEAAAKVPEIQLTGAWIDGKLAAYAVNCRDASWTYGLYQFSRTENLKDSVNQALDFHLLQEAAQDPSVVGLTNGPLPVRPAEGLHLYKTRMGYEVESHRVAIRFRDPLHKLVASNGVTQLCDWINERWCHEKLAYFSQILATAHGETSPLSTAGSLVAQPPH